MIGSDDDDDGDDGIDVTVEDCLVESAADGDLEAVQRYVASGNVDINGTDRENGKTALQVASYNGCVPIVCFLLENGADVHEGPTGYAPIHLACENGAEEVIAVLLSYGASVQERDISNRTPIYIASGRVSNDTVKLLLSVGASPYDRDFPKFNPLCAAALSGHNEVVETLLSHGANVNGRDVFGRTPLQSACYGAHLPKRWDYDQLPYLTVKTLLEHGADPNIPDSGGHNTIEMLRNTSFWTKSRNVSALFPLLLDYGTGSGVPCHLALCHCNKTVLTCQYNWLRSIRRKKISDPDESTFYESICDSFERHFIKTRTALLECPCAEKEFEPPVENVDWSWSKRQGYRNECEAELCRMKTDQIGETSATYFDLLTRNESVLGGQKILGYLNVESLQSYPIYANMIYCSYVRLRMFFIVEKCVRFFSILSPRLLPDCVKQIVGYLSDTDTDNLDCVYRMIQQ